MLLVVEDDERNDAVEQGVALSLPNQSAEQPSPNSGYNGETSNSSLAEAKYVCLLSISTIYFKGNTYALTYSKPTGPSKIIFM